MTARFTFKHFDWLQWHIFDNEEYLCEVTLDEDAERLIGLLNQLSTENRQLHEIIDKQSDRIITLANENTKIQNTITEAYQNERTSLGKSVLKQLIKQME
jgi:hypothetical protein